MIRFESDYLEGGHDSILKKLADTNRLQTPGYGVDKYCETARSLLRRECDAPDAEVHFLVGGTQANTIMIASILRPHQAALAAETGHIAVHETGAIEATGHKVVTLEGRDGKITAETVRRTCERHWGDSEPEHVTQPGLVYVSQPTETGMLYRREELAELSATCRKFGLPLVVDGARLGYGVEAPGNDVGLRDLAQLCDMFTIGGTKVGALFGEAVVITKRELGKDFRYIIKQKGGMLAKGRLLGLQFEALFESGEYYLIARRAVGLAMRIRDALVEAGAQFLYPPQTNQLFPILSNRSLEILGKKYSYSLIEEIADTQAAAVRFCTSWATREEDVQMLVKDILALPKPV